MSMSWNTSNVEVQLSDVLVRTIPCCLGAAMTTSGSVKTSMSLYMNYLYYYWACLHAQNQNGPHMYVNSELAL